MPPLHFEIEGGLAATDVKPALVRDACELYDVVVEIECAAIGSELIRGRIVMRIARVKADYRCPGTQRERLS
jgi:hypothetical protein